MSVLEYRGPKPTPRLITLWSEHITSHLYSNSLGYKKEHIWVNPNEVDEPRACCTEWSQKDKYRIVTHAYEIYKDGTDNPICRAAIEKQT